MDLKAWKIWRQGTNAQFLNKGSAASAGDGLDHLSGGGKQLRKLLKPQDNRENSRVSTRFHYGYQVG
jgi:hypothetical protein